VTTARKKNLIVLAHSVWDKFKIRPYPLEHSAIELLMIIEPVRALFGLSDAFSLMLILRCYGQDDVAATSTFEWLAFEVAAVVNQLSGAGSCCP
jgi:hypothetical protein